MFICMQKSTSFIPSFSRYYKNITNLVCWVLWAYLVMTTKNDDLNVQETLMFIFIEKMNFTPHLILEILLRYCKLVIMGTLDMLGYGYNKMVISV